MKHPKLALGLCLLGSLTVVLGLFAEGGPKGVRASIRMVPDGNLQVGVTGELLPAPISVRATPGVEVTFFSPDLGLIEETGQAFATVSADPQGLASVHVRLGRNLGRYTVIASLAQGDGPQIAYTFRAISDASMVARKAQLGLGESALDAATSTEGGAR